MSSLEPQILERISLAIQNQGLTHQENHKQTALELLSRVISLRTALTTLKLPYTYQIKRVTAQKQAARLQIGNLASEIIEAMQDELLEAGVASYLLSRGLTIQQVDAIFGGADGPR